MATVTFITGNPSKAEYLARYLGFPVAHQAVELEEIQSLDLRTIVTHKVRQAYDIIRKPVLVEDVSLVFHALGELPGPFIRFYVETVPFEIICRMLDGFPRDATARCVFGYYDGQIPVFFEGTLRGTIAEHPSGKKGFGWDAIFIPEGYTKTRAQLSEKDDHTTYLQLKPFDQIKRFLRTRQ